MKEILKQATVLYVEDEDKLRESFTLLLKIVMKKVYVAKDGQEGIEIFIKNQKSIDLVITDIEMPNLNGIELLKKIRVIDNNIPCIIVSAFFAADYLHDSIKHNVSGYFTKPIDTTKFFEKLAYLHEKEFNAKKIVYKERELRDYLEILNKVAIISKTDLKGVITYVNDIFCEVAKYKSEELIGKPHNIIRHPDMPKSAFQDMWETIKSEKMWSGKVKNRAKDGSAYYVKASVFPIYEHDELIGYIGIRFLTTEEENEKRKFQKKVISNLTETRKKELELEKSNSFYKTEISELRKSFDELSKKFDKTAKTALDQGKRIRVYEKELNQNESKLMNLLTSKKEELEQYIKVNKKLRLDKDILINDNKEKEAIIKN